jgi:hypothetical protein
MAAISVFIVRAERERDRESARGRETERERERASEKRAASMSMAYAVCALYLQAWLLALPWGTAAAGNAPAAFASASHGGGIFCSAPRAPLLPGAVLSLCAQERSAESGAIGEVAFSDHFFTAVRATGVSNILPGPSRRYYGKYPEWTRGARRPKQRTLYGTLSAEARERLRYDEQQQILADELEHLGAPPAPGLLSARLPSLRPFF